MLPLALANGLFGEGIVRLLRKCRVDISVVGVEGEFLPSCICRLASTPCRRRVALIREIAARADDGIGDIQNVVVVFRAENAGGPVQFGLAEWAEIAAKTALPGFRHDLLEVRIANEEILQEAGLGRVRRSRVRRAWAPGWPRHSRHKPRGSS